jgi:hypothetical protein
MPSMTTQKPKRPRKGPAARATRSATTKRAAVRTMPLRRADFGAPIDGFFAKQPPHLRAILEDLRKLVEDVAPDATASIKWGMPFYSIGSGMMCALAGFRSHVNLILSGPPDSFADPKGQLEGGGKTGRHLKLRTAQDLPRAAVRAWLRTAARNARAKKA